MPATTLSRRDYLLNHFASPEGVRDSDIRHLWHLEHLARARLGPSRGVQDAPEVDFHDPEYISDDQLRAVGFHLDCQQRRRQAEAAQLRRANAEVFDKLVRAVDDDERRRRHMNVFPHGHNELIEMDRIHDQHVQRDRDRVRRQKVMDGENAKLLKRLQAATSELPRTAQLDAWYRGTHSQRVRKLSRFRKAQPFAGARVLENECHVRLPFAITTRRAHVIATVPAPSSAASATAKTVRAPFSAAPPHPDMYGPLVDTRPPLLLHQPFPPPTVGDVLPWVPSARQPLHTSTHFGQTPRCSLASLTTQHTGATPTLREARPAWQPLAATDIPLYHYTKDLELRPDAHATVRHADQECGCTALWRSAARHHREAYESQRREDEIAISSLRAREEARLVSLQEKLRRRSSLHPQRQRPVQSTELPAVRAHSSLRVASHTLPQRGVQMDAISSHAEAAFHGASDEEGARACPPHPPAVDQAGGGVAAEVRGNDDDVRDRSDLSALLSQWRVAQATQDSAPFAPL